MMNHGGHVNKRQQHGVIILQLGGGDVAHTARHTNKQVHTRLKTARSVPWLL